MLIPVGLFGGPHRQGYRLTRIIFTNAMRVQSGLCTLLWAGAVMAAGAGTLGGSAVPSAPASLLLPSIEILSQQTKLARTCGRAVLALNALINRGARVSPDVTLA